MEQERSYASIIVDGHSRPLQTAEELRTAARYLVDLAAWIESKPRFDSTMPLREFPVSQEPDAALAANDAKLAVQSVESASPLSPDDTAPPPTIRELTREAIQSMPRGVAWRTKEIHEIVKRTRPSVHYSTICTEVSSASPRHCKRIGGGRNTGWISVEHSVKPEQPKTNVPTSTEAAVLPQRRANDLGASHLGILRSFSGVHGKASVLYKSGQVGDVDVKLIPHPEREEWFEGDFLHVHRDGTASFAMHFEPTNARELLECIQPGLGAPVRMKQATRKEIRQLAAAA